MRHQWLPLLGALVLLTVNAESANMEYLDGDFKGDAPPPCLDTDQDDYDHDSTLSEFQFFSILWLFMTFLQMFRSSGFSTIFHAGFGFIIVSIGALYISVDQVIDRSEPCKSALAVCSTISCVAANVVWQGYVWMFVVLGVNAALALRLLGHNATRSLSPTHGAYHAYLHRKQQLKPGAKLCAPSPPQEDHVDDKLRVEPSDFYGYVIAMGTVLTTATGIMPSLKADPEDSTARAIHRLDAFHVIGVAVGGLLIMVGCTGARFYSWSAEMKANKICCEPTFGGCLYSKGLTEDPGTKLEKLTGKAKKKAMFKRAKGAREDRGFLWDWLAIIIVAVYSSRFLVANVRPFPPTYKSHLCLKYTRQDDCSGSGRDLFIEKLEPWPCHWVNRDENRTAEVLQDTTECIFGCCSSNARCFDPQFAAYHEKWGLNEREHDRGRCPWKANAASIAYEYTLLIFILQVLLNYFCSKVTDDESESLGFGSETDDESESLGFGSERAKKSDKGVGPAERILNFLKVGVWPVSSAWWIRTLHPELAGRGHDAGVCCLRLCSKPMDAGADKDSALSPYQFHDV